MPLGDSVIVGTAGLGGDVADAGSRGFFAAFPVLRLALAVCGIFLAFALFLAIRPPRLCSIM